MARLSTSVGYPRTYRPGLFWAVFYLVGGSIFVVFGALGIWYFGTGHEHVHGTAKAFAVAMSGLFLLFGLYYIAYFRGAKLTLRYDEIELTGMFRTKRLRRDDIAGYRWWTVGRAASSLLILPRDENQRKLEIPGIIDLDATFYEWLGHHHDSGRMEEQESADQSEADFQLGSTLAQRQGSPRNARSVCRALMVFTFVVGAWAWLYPSPYRLVVTILAALPWVAVYVTARYRGEVVINQKRRDTHPGVGIPFIMPGLILSLRVLNEMRPMVWKEPLVLSMVVSGALAFAAWKVDGQIQRKPAITILLFLLGMAYGYGVTMEANALLDRTPVTVYKTSITEKYVSSGRSTTYNFNLAPWGPMTNGDHVQIPRRFYNEKQVGDAVCVGVRQGALKIPWYFVRDCR